MACPDRRALVAVLVMCGAAGSGACSLLTSTSGLSGGNDVVSDGGGTFEAGDAGDAGALGEGGADAAFDAARDPHLMAEYSFEDVGGQGERDSSGNERHGLAQAGATFVADGVRGQALAVDTTGFFVVNALSGPGFPRTGTLSLWFRYSFPQSSTTGRSIFDFHNVTRNHVFVRRADGATGGKFQVALQASNGAYAFVSGFVAEPSKWTHVVVTWDDATQEAALHVDGVFNARAPYTLPFTPDGQLFRLGEGLIGAIDEVRLFDRALSDAEAAKLD
jgi:hypothetical protein